MAAQMANIENLMETSVAGPSVLAVMQWSAWLQFKFDGQWGIAMRNQTNSNLLQHTSCTHWELLKEKKYDLDIYNHIQWDMKQSSMTKAHNEDQRNKAKKIIKSALKYPKI